MKRLIVGILVLALAVVSLGMTAFADYWWAGYNMDCGRGGAGDLPGWMDITESGPAG